MPRLTRRLLAGHACLLVLLAADPLAGQVFESVGTRALGMGGAFVAVADDATATYWNPAGLATGPFLDFRLEWLENRAGEGADGSATAVSPATRASAGFVGLAVPAIGLSYTRLRSLGVWRPAGPTGTSGDDRQDGGPDTVGVTSLTVYQMGVTLVQTVVDGVAVGTTVKLVRELAGSVEGASVGSTSSYLDEAARLDGVPTNRIDLDIGAMAVLGPAHLGIVARNLRSRAGRDGGAGQLVSLCRQVRLGAALLPGRGSAEGVSAGMIFSVDADVTRTPTPLGDRRNVAMGVERWWVGHRIGLRGGLRVNTIEQSRPVGTTGVSVLVRNRVLVEGHFTRGGRTGDRAWGVGGRVAFE